MFHVSSQIVTNISESSLFLSYSSSGMAREKILPEDYYPYAMFLQILLLRVAFFLFLYLNFFLLTLF